MRGREPLEISLRPKQLDIFNDPHRFKIVVAGRRFGKTYLSRAELFDKALAVRRSTSWYLTLTYRLAKELMWRPLKDSIPKSYIQHKDETDLSIILKNGSTIALRGADNPDSLRGPGLDLLICDEFSFMDPYVWSVTRPMLADKEGTALFIGTPNGLNWGYDLFMDSMTRPAWKQWTFTTADGGNVSEEEIAEARATMDPRLFRQEFLASFEDLAGRVYYAFDRLLNCPDEVEDDGVSPLLVGIDFNVAPMSAVLGIRKGKQVHIFDEISIMNGNTLLLTQEIRRRFPGRPVIAYPDPTGSARHTNAPVGQTDFAYLRAANFSVIAPAAPHAMADKINQTNAALCNASGERRCLINRRCKKTIRSLDGLVYTEGTSLPDKKSGLDHQADAICYLLCMEYPINTPVRRIATVGA